MKQIVIDITEDGEVKIETRGFTGKSCVEESRFLKELLGKELARQLTTAYYQVDGKTCVKKHLPLCG
ncbi:DUF2997 domain-containing protein [Desulforhabdus sp. TSK]|uniref:DUF2997 domain-containing protein n=1 Tax=Desulforhabdus sp. TSK TaxID=2925014 RepID=UPI001FC871AC|nr:DUF2997 domain-containing protein [Desulforhabdus sp. TSK]GKT09109.1 hypothetical protein DSTSK_24140 [Desulforhabdus sp. TSK]